MKISLWFAMLLVVLSNKSLAQEWTLKSPNEAIDVRISISEEKEILYAVSYNGAPILLPATLGVVMSDEEYTKGMALTSASTVKPIDEFYTMMQGKRRQCHYQANEQSFHFVNPRNKKMDVVFRVSDDGVAFRYFFPGKKKKQRHITKEITTFHFAPGARAFLQPMSEAKTGWSKVNPCYEEHYQMDIPAGTPSPTKAGWVFPALFRLSNHWVLITEAGLNGNYCAARFAQNSPDGVYRIDFPAEQEGFPGKEVKPASSLPWYTPWRIIALGDLKTVMESTLGTDLAEKSAIEDQSFVKPGLASWSWALLKDDSIVYEVQKRFIDYAADMNWAYCLVDVNWDTRIGYEKIKELSAYAQSRKVGLILWYNSSGDWNDTRYTPKSKLLTHEDRIKEFDRLKAIGVKGIKVDFFGGDGQSMIQYYLDILNDAATYGLLVNFHGSTIPRGWQRTYPHLMSMEAVKGFEYVTFEQQNADAEPAHCTILPFTRNIFDPMDFTPLSLYKIPGIQRRTTSAFELALPVLFLSGIQHLAETPTGMQHAPAFVKDFLRSLPAQWDDTKFVQGFPGKEVVIARTHNGAWYIAGINGEDLEKNLTLDLSFVQAGKKGYMITEGKVSGLQQVPVENTKQTMSVSLHKNGGFVIVLK